MFVGVVYLTVSVVLPSWPAVPSLPLRTPAKSGVSSRCCSDVEVHSPKVLTMRQSATGDERLEYYFLPSFFFFFQWENPQKMRTAEGLMLFDFQMRVRQRQFKNLPCDFETLQKKRNSVREVRWALHPSASCVLITVSTVVAAVDTVHQKPELQCRRKGCEFRTHFALTVL